MDVLSVDVAPGGGDDKARSGAEGFMMFAPLIAIGIIFYFLLLRPQRKEQASREAMLAALKKNDKVAHDRRGHWQRGQHFSRRAGSHAQGRRQHPHQIRPQQHSARDVVRRGS